MRGNATLKYDNNPQLLVLCWVSVSMPSFSLCLILPYLPDPATAPQVDAFYADDPYAGSNDWLSAWNDRSYISKRTSDNAARSGKADGRSVDMQPEIIARRAMFLTPVRTIDLGVVLAGTADDSNDVVRFLKGDMLNSAALSDSVKDKRGKWDMGEVQWDDDNAPYELVKRKCGLGFHRGAGCIRKRRQTPKRS